VSFSIGDGLRPGASPTRMTRLVGELYVQGELTTRLEAWCAVMNGSRPYPHA
jgi:thiamine biosynthesis protein ThiC